MANFITTLIKSTLTLITYHSIIFTIEDMLNVLVLSQTTNINKITRRNNSNVLLFLQINGSLNFLT